MDKEKAILVGCELPENRERFVGSMRELEALTETAKGEVIYKFTQKRDTIHPSLYIGKGKVREILTFLETEDHVDVIIFNDELSAGQLRNLTDLLGIKIIDRTQLILDIFASRAHSKEGKLQVELAQLKYTLPRLTGKGIILSRLGGGIGTRGPGETQLETDRRHIYRRIQAIEQQLKRIVEHREQYKERRKRNDVFQITLVGYTNAGKSTLFNRLTSGDSYEEDKLFATLDPLTRKIDAFQPITALLTDTVGFIQDLPTDLIAAFRSTLEEVTEADLIVHVIDASDEHYIAHEKTVNQLLRELEADAIPKINVYNKKDLIDDKETNFFPTTEQSILISSFLEEDIINLLSFMKKIIHSQLRFYTLHVDVRDGKRLALLQSQTIIKEKLWDEENEQFLISGYAHHAVIEQMTKKSY